MPLPTDTPPQRRRLPTAAACALAAALLGTLAGCTTWPAPPPAGDPALPAPATPATAPSPAPAASAASAPAPAPAPAPDPAALADAAARRLLAYHERLRELTPPQLAQEYLRLADPTPAPGPEQVAKALEMALLLGQRQQNGDLVRALALLEPHLRTPGPWQALARLLHGKLQEQRRLEEQLDKQGLQLRDQQRRIEQLASQLEALKAIERSLNNPRPAAPAPRPAP